MSVLDVLSKLRVEPVLFLFYVSTIALSTGSGVLIGQKFCFPDAPPGVSVVCKDNDKLKESTNWSLVKVLFREVVPAIVCLLAGSWRDATRRSRPLILMAHVGEIISTSVQLYSSINWSMSPILTVLLDSLIGGVLGSRAVVTMASLSHVMERITTKEENNARMLFLMIAMLGGMSLAVTLGGKLLLEVDFPLFFTVLLIMYITSLLITFFFVWDGEDVSDVTGYFESLGRIKVIFQSRPNNAPIWCFIVASGILTALLGGENMVSSNYYIKKFNMTPDLTGYLGGYKTVLSFLGAALFTPLFNHLLKLSGFTIAAICVVPGVVSAIGMALSETITQLYIFATLDLMRILLISTLMSLFTSCLRKPEIGVYTSFLTFVEGILPVVMAPVYLIIFNLTFDSMPGACFLVSAALTTLAGIIIWVASCLYVKPINAEEEEPAVMKDGENGR